MSVFATVNTDEGTVAVGRDDYNRVMLTTKRNDGETCIVLRMDSVAASCLKDVLQAALKEVMRNQK